jgi:sugar phosphate isomerase/epimerase
MKTPRIAVQLYSVRDDCQKDLPGTIEQVAAMGYAGVEFAGYYGYSAQELRAMLDANGLLAAGTHIGVEAFQPTAFENTVTFNRKLGNRLLIVPGLPESWGNSIAALTRTAEFLNECTAKLAPHGMLIGYHNHAHEFTPMEGRIPFEVLFDLTTPAVVMQADTGNARTGGADAVVYIERYKGRSVSVHLKEFSNPGQHAMLGEGAMDWPRVFRACETVGGTEWYIVEQEEYPFPPLECIRRCRANLKKMGK